jgi:hypothetical protein
MPAGATYEPIATQTLSANTSSITFSSIPSTYTDLVFVMNYAMNDATSGYFRVNGDTGAMYSAIELRGNGSSVVTYNTGTISRYYFNVNAFPITTFGTTIVQLQNYSNTTTNKTFMSRTSATTGAYAGVSLMLGTYTGTSAINSLTLDRDGPGGSYYYLAGSTFTLYGIKAA